VSIFTCTSPAEIYGYGFINKIVSKDLKRFFYQREFDNECVRSVSVEDVLEIVRGLKSEKKI
jgi:hypothetical protein